MGEYRRGPEDGDGRQRHGDLAPHRTDGSRYEGEWQGQHHICPELWRLQADPAGRRLWRVEGGAAFPGARAGQDAGAAQQDQLPVRRNDEPGRSGSCHPQGTGPCRAQRDPAFRRGVLSNGSTSALPPIRRNSASLPRSSRGRECRSIPAKASATGGRRPRRSASAASIRQPATARAARKRSRGP